MPKTVVAYARVSSREQAEDFHALEQQQARLKSAGASQVYTDIESGSKDDRKSFRNLMELVTTKQVDEVIVTRIDRLTRSLPNLRKIIDTFNESGINLVILDQNIDLNTAQGRLMVNILGSLAEWETDLLSERVKHGKQHYRNQGKACEAAPWGYKALDGKYVLDKSPFLCLISEDKPNNYLELYGNVDIDKLPARTIVDLAKESITTYCQQKSIRGALAVLFEKYGVTKTRAKINSHNKVFYWTQRGFSLWITNPVLCGHTAYLKEDKNTGRYLKNHEDWQIIRNTHPEEILLTDREAEEIKTLFKVNYKIGSGSLGKKATTSNHYRQYAYQTGIIYCGVCGSRCTVKTCGSNYKYGYYVCRYTGLGCHNHKSVRRDLIEEGLIEALVEKSLTLAKGQEQKSEVTLLKSERLMELEAKLEAIEKIPGFDPDLESFKQKLRQQIEVEKSPILLNSVATSTAEEIIRFGNNLAFWYTLTSDEKVDIYSKLVFKIVICHGRVESVVLKL